MIVDSSFVGIRRNFRVPSESFKAKSHPTLGKWMRRVRRNNELNQEQFAEMIGTSESLVGAMERGERTVAPPVIAQILTAFPGTPEPYIGPDIVVTGETIGTDRRGMIPYAGVVPCSEEWGDPLDGDDIRPVDLKFVGKKRFLATVAGDSCEDALFQGDLTVWEIDPAPPYGVIVLAQRESDHSCTVKQLVQGPDGSEILKPVNPKSKPPSNEGGWRKVAKLVGVIRLSEPPEITVYWPAGIRPEHLIKSPVLLAAERRANY